MAQTGKSLRNLRLMYGLSIRRVADFYGIPVRTWENWESGQRKPPDYLVDLLIRCMCEDIDTGEFSD